MDSKHRPPNEVDSKGGSIPFGWSPLRVGRELNPPGGKPDPRVKSPMLCLAELPTRLSPQQTAVLLRSSRRCLDLRAVSIWGEKTPNRDKHDSKRRAPRGL